MCLNSSSVSLCEGGFSGWNLMPTIYLRGMRERGMRSGTELAREIQPNDWSTAREQDKFRSSHHRRNLFHFSQREKIVFTWSKLHINTSFLSRKNVEKKFILTTKIFFRNFNPIYRLRFANKPV